MFLRAAAQRLQPPALAPAVRGAVAGAGAAAARRRPAVVAMPCASAGHFSTSGRLLQNRFNASAPSSKPTPKQSEPAPAGGSRKPSESKAADTAAEVEAEIPLSSLPDLTQGIPSTLDHETAGATNKASLAAYLEAGDKAAAAAAAAGDAGAEGLSSGGSDGPGGRRPKGELPASAYVSSSERRRQKMANYLFLGGLGLGVAGTAYCGRDWDEEEAARHPGVPNGWGLGLWWARVSARSSELLSYYRDPAFEKLLPDPDPMYSRPYTLCISLEDMLVHSEWTREHGWRIAKRPGVDYFLHYLSQYYELVLFTTVPFGIGEPLVRKLDPYRFIVWPLYREATKYKDGEIVKDLSYLNRDLSKVIIMDTNAAHVRAQPENAIVLPKWTGDAKDRELVAFVPFLEYIFTMQYGDVRKVLKSFDGTNIPQEFARREALARTEFQKQLDAQRKKRAGSGGGSGIAGLGALLGLKSSNMSMMVSTDGNTTLTEELAQGKMLQDIARERGQRAYETMEKEIRENGEKWLKEEAAMQEKMQQEAMQNIKQSFSGWFVNSQKQAPPPATVAQAPPQPSSEQKPAPSA